MTNTTTGYDALCKAISDLKLMPYTLAESNYGSTGYIERGHTVPQFTHGSDKFDRIWAHLGYFEVHLTSTWSTIDMSSTGHLIAFSRYTTNLNGVVVPVCDSGGCFSGQLVSSVLAAFAEARKTGETVKVEYDGAKYEITPVTGNLGLAPKSLDSMIVKIETAFAQLANCPKAETLQRVIQTCRKSADLLRSPLMTAATAPLLLESQAAAMSTLRLVMESCLIGDVRTSEQTSVLSSMKWCERAYKAAARTWQGTPTEMDEIED